MDKLIEVWVLISWWEGDAAHPANLKVVIYNHRKKCEDHASTFSEGVEWMIEMHRMK